MYFNMFFLVPGTVDGIGLSQNTEPKIVQRFNRDTRPVQDLLQPETFACTNLEPREKVEPLTETSRLEELMRYQEDLSPGSCHTSQSSSSSRLQEIMESFEQSPLRTSSSPLNSDSASPPSIMSDTCTVMPKSSGGATYRVNAPVLEGLIYAFDNSNLNQLLEDANMLMSPSPSMADLEYCETDMDFDTTSFQNFDSDLAQLPDFQIESLVHTYQISVGQISNQQISSFAEAIGFEKKDIFKFVTEVTRQYTKFALLQR